MIWRAFLIWLVMAGGAFAVQPNEVLDDPVLEERAREISKGLRCPVCRNESIDESNAGVSGDLRVLVRERLVAGDSDAEVIDYVVDRYGEYVLLNPPATGSNLILWVAGPVLFLAALGISGAYLTRRRAAPVPEALSEDEEARLSELLDK